jgi:N-methylhydantoinase B
MTNTLNTPIEVIEHYYPIRFETYGIRGGSGGLGEWRGGNGIERSFTARATVQVTLLGDRSRLKPWGLRGGLPGETSEYSLRKVNGEVIRLNSKEAAVLCAGDTLIIRTAGGGGYGNPVRRSPTRIREDLENEYITSDQARRFEEKVLAT